MGVAGTIFKRTSGQIPQAPGFVPASSTAEPLAATAALRRNRLRAICADTGIAVTQPEPVLRAGVSFAIWMAHSVFLNLAVTEDAF